MVTGQADVKHKIGFVRSSTRYKYQGTEAWKDGRLLRLESTCNDDGKQHAVSATAEPEATRVKADGHERTTRPDVWTTSYWHLADAKFRNQSVPLLDADTGKDITGTLQYIGTQQLNVTGQAENCATTASRASRFKPTCGTTARNAWSARNRWRTATARSWSWSASASRQRTSPQRHREHRGRR